jgi:O-6-methylguanine DNA methyltransferase
MNPSVVSADWHGYVDTPLGPVLVLGRADALTGLYFDGYPHTPRLGAAASGDDARLAESSGQFDEDVDGDPNARRLHGGARRNEALFTEARRQLDEYFDGRRASFTLSVDPAGTLFQRAVWAALLDVPCGETTSYGALAVGLGRPQASRAVGAANGANPISIVIPCHRVVGATGSLTGYGWGIEKKSWLLDHERAMSHR